MRTEVPGSAIRLRRSVHAACSFLLHHDVDRFPVDVLQLMRQLPKLRILTYRQAAAVHHLPGAGAITDAIGTEDAFTVYDPCSGIHTVFYQDEGRSPERIRFTLAHELGHILLRHMDEFSAMTMTADASDALEREADLFAANLLAPVPLMRALRAPKPEDRLIFALSAKSWSVRLETWERDARLWLSPQDDRLLTECFRPFMDRRICPGCGYVSQDAAAACPHCGFQHLIWSSGFPSPGLPFTQSHEDGLLRRETGHFDNPMLEDALWPEK